MSIGWMTVVAAMPARPPLMKGSAGRMYGLRKSAWSAGGGASACAGSGDDEAWDMGAAVKGGPYIRARGRLELVKRGHAGPMTEARFRTLSLPPGKHANSRKQ